MTRMGHMNARGSALLCAAWAWVKRLVGLQEGMGIGKEYKVVVGDFYATLYHSHIAARFRAGARCNHVARDQ